MLTARKSSLHLLQYILYISTLYPLLFQWSLCSSLMFLHVLYVNIFWLSAECVHTFIIIIIVLLLCGHLRRRHKWRIGSKLLAPFHSLRGQSLSNGIIWTDKRRVIKKRTLPSSPFIIPRSPVLHHCQLPTYLAVVFFSLSFFVF